MARARKKKETKQDSRVRSFLCYAEDYYEYRLSSYLHFED